MSAYRPGAESHALGSSLRLALGVRPQGGRSGGTLGRAPGSSLEFEDRRGYVAGDDVRHVDWRAMARTDQVLVRQHREEVTPVLELLVDDSASLGVDPAKAQLCVDLIQVLGLAARSAGFALRMIRLGDRSEPLEVQRFESLGLSFEGRSSLQDGVQGATALLRPGTARVLVSDFLSAHEPSALVRRLAAGAGAVGLIQVLSGFDADPPVGDALRLEDAESGASQDLVLDERTVAAYRSRLERLQAGLAQECRRAGAPWVSLVAGEGDALVEACRGDLCRSGLLLPDA